ncbi:MAG: hypothetical protein ACREL5_04685 [Gemmatimonadales bacterium]
MPASQVGADTSRARLQLAIGPMARLGTELAPQGHGRAFAAEDRHGAALLVTFFDPPPAGPDLPSLDQRLASLRTAAHRAIVVPIAAGAIDGRTWQIEIAPRGVTVRERLVTGPVGIGQGIGVLRDLARALVTLHRRGVAHGAITLDTVRVVGNGGVLYGAGGAVAVASVRGDLDALGRVIWALLTGETEPDSNRRLSDYRRGVPPALDVLCAGLLDGVPERRPRRAGAILDALDLVPTRRFSPLAAIVDAGSHDVRSPRRAGWALVAAAVLVVGALVALSLR